MFIAVFIRFNSLRSVVRYRPEHLKIKFVSTSGHVIFFLLYNEREIKGILAIPEDFRTFSQDFQRFLKILRTLSEVHRNISGQFSKMSVTFIWDVSPWGSAYTGGLGSGTSPFDKSHLYTTHTKGLEESSRRRLSTLWCLHGGIGRTEGQSELVFDRLIFFLIWLHGVVEDKHY